MKTLTKLEILKETFEFYNSNPKKRGISSTTGKCVYLDLRTGKRCAIGRCLRIPKIERKNSDFWSVTIALKYLMGRYRGNAENFWNLIQDFHDTKGYWTNKGITILGLERYELLTDIFSKED